MKDYCCQAPARVINPYNFSIDDLTMVRRDEKFLRFSPLGNSSSEPRLVLVGITPGKQSEYFAKLLKTHTVHSAAKKASFHGAQKAIKEMLQAHGFAHALKINLDGDLNENPQILTTSLVKCCLMVNGSYKYKAPDLVTNPEASYCARIRFCAEIERHPSLRYAIIFGEPGWQAVNQLRVGQLTIRQVLEKMNIEVLNFPHFAQNYQQREIFKIRPDQEEALFAKKSSYRGYAPNVRTMKTALFGAIERMSGRPIC